MYKFAQPPRILIVPLTAAAMTLALASPSLAQQARPGEQLGMRYLSWAGKPAAQNNDQLRRPGDVTPRQQVSNLQPAAATTGPVRPNRYGAPSNGLTPASAWTTPPAPAPQYAPPQAPQPYSSPTAPLRDAAAQAPAQMQTASAPAYDAGRSLRRQDPYIAAPPQVQMAMQPAPQPTYLPPPTTVPTAVEPAAPAAGYDPMAPRADAPIYRLGRAAQPQVQAQVEAPAQAAPQPLAQQVRTQPGQPPREGARYYSVHREAGHEPDPMTLPESVFIGGASADLAEPPPAPVIQRTINGRNQIIANAQDPSLP